MHLASHPPIAPAYQYLASITLAHSPTRRPDELERTTQQAALSGCRIASIECTSGPGKLHVYFFQFWRFPSPLIGLGSLWQNVGRDHPSPNPPPPRRIPDQGLHEPYQILREPSHPPTADSCLIPHINNALHQLTPTRLPQPPKTIHHPPSTYPVHTTFA